MKSPYPQHLHLTHYIPPIAMRERGVEPIPFILRELPHVTDDSFKYFADAQCPPISTDGTRSIPTT